ncbi:hypothetical protein M426DRAFT_26864 [Hypoxylon sp. CI-4A]|nr:hypothetical protein M426DRAFT_26864 [Hypoxylon sp. CI-4A]
MRNAAMILAFLASGALSSPAKRNNGGGCPAYNPCPDPQYPVPECCTLVGVTFCEPAPRTPTSDADFTSICGMEQKISQCCAAEYSWPRENLGTDTNKGMAYRAALDGKSKRVHDINSVEADTGG